MESLEAAVCYLFRVGNVSPNSPEYAAFTEAQAHCEAAKQHEQSWQMALTWFIQTSQPAMQFWCLQILRSFMEGQYPQLPLETRQEFCQHVVSWLSQGKLLGCPSHVRNAYAHLIFLIATHTFAKETWPMFFQDTLLGYVASAQSEDAYDMFLRVLQTIDTEYVARPTQSPCAVRFKDLMRAHAVADIVSAWRFMCTQTFQQFPVITRQTLKIMEPFIHWIDISLVTDSQFLGILTNMLAAPQLADEAAMCLHAIVSKRMDHSKKYPFLQSLNLIALLMGMSSQLQLSEKLACLINVLAMEWLGIWQHMDQNPEIFTIFATCLPLVFQCMESPNFCHWTAMLSIPPQLCPSYQATFS